MAQLPPKIPTIPQNWSPFPHQRVQSTMSNFTPSTSSPTPTSSTTQQQQQQQQLSSTSSWVEEFLDFSSARRGAHRRSASDSAAFLESPMMFFDRLDDDQLMLMFSDDVAAVSQPNAPPLSTSDPSSPSSDQTSNNEEKPMVTALDVAPHVQEQHHDLHVKPKSEAVEEDGSCKNEPEALPPFSSTTGSDETVVDPKRVKRILANRQSAQRSRVRKLQYISELERSVTTLQTEVSALSPRVAFLDHQRLILNVDNSTLKQRIAALAQDKIFKDAHQEALKKEIERLRQIYLQQNIQKMGNSVNNNNDDHSLPSPRTSQAQLQPHSLHHHQLVASQSLVCKDNEQLLS